MSERETGLGRLLRERREALGLSRTRLGEAVGIAPGTLEGWELGRVAKPPIHDVLRVARALGIGLPELEAAVLAREPKPVLHAAPAAGDQAPQLLEHAIELLGWSEATAATALGVTKTRIRAWRAGREPLPLPTLLTIVALLGLRAAEEAGGDIAGLLPALDRGSARLD